MRVIVLLALGLIAYVGCGQSVVGRECVTEPCPRNFVCALDHDGNRVCTNECDATRVTACPTGELCVPWMGDGHDECYPGGILTYGSSCTSSLDCTHGGICVGISGGTPPMYRCFRACNLGEPNTCPGSLFCARTLEGSGYCPN